MLKGITIETILVVFGLVFVSFILAFTASLPLPPSDEMGAMIISESIISDTAALFISDGGKVTKTFEKPWTIEISNNEIRVKRDNVKSDWLEFIGDMKIDDITLENIKQLTIEKRNGKIIFSGV